MGMKKQKQEGSNGSPVESKKPDVVQKPEESKKLTKPPRPPQKPSEKKGKSIETSTVEIKKVSAAVESPKESLNARQQEGARKVEELRNQMQEALLGILEKDKQEEAERAKMLHQVNV